MLDGRRECSAFVFAVCVWHLLGSLSVFAETRGRLAAREQVLAKWYEVGAHLISVLKEETEQGFLCQGFVSIQEVCSSSVVFFLFLFF